MVVDALSVTVFGRWVDRRPRKDVVYSDQLGVQRKEGNRVVLFFFPVFFLTMSRHALVEDGYVFEDSRQGFYRAYVVSPGNFVDVSIDPRDRFLRLGPLTNAFQRRRHWEVPVSREFVFVTTCALQVAKVAKSLPMCLLFTNMVVANGED